jgi:hypothetical protein
MHFTALLVICFGAVGIVFGGWGYLDGRAERTFRQRKAGPMRIGLGPSAPLTLALNGIGLAFIGVAFNFHRSLGTLSWLWAGCAAIAAGVLIYAVNPGWAKPRWMPSDLPPGDASGDHEHQTRASR